MSLNRSQKGLKFLLSSPSGTGNEMHGSFIILELNGLSFKYELYYLLAISSSIKWREIITTVYDCYMYTVYTVYD